MLKGPVASSASFVVVVALGAAPTVQAAPSSFAVAAIASAVVACTLGSS